MHWLTDKQQQKKKKKMYRSNCPLKCACINDIQLSLWLLIHIYIHLVIYYKAYQLTTKKNWWKYTCFLYLLIKMVNWKCTTKERTIPPDDDPRSLKRCSKRKRKLTNKKKLESAKKKSRLLIANFPFSLCVCK